MMTISRLAKGFEQCYTILPSVRCEYYIETVWAGLHDPLVARSSCERKMCAVHRLHVAEYNTVGHAAN